MSYIRPVLTNQRLTPYRTESTDKLQVKLEVYKRNRLINVNNLPVELWLNYSGSWFKVDSNTNRYGTQTIYYPCVNISGINCCLGYVSININNIIYNSNVIRFNFIQGYPYQDTNLVIDGGTCSEQIIPIDRSEYNIYDAGENVTDRLDYLILNRMHEAT